MELSSLETFGQCNENGCLSFGQIKTISEIEDTWACYKLGQNSEMKGGREWACMVTPFRRHRSKRFTPLESLGLSRCQLTDELVSARIPRCLSLNISSNKLTGNFLSTCLPRLSNLEYLNLRDNNFTLLPEGINKLYFLRTLILDCNKLKEIRGILPNIKALSALRCPYLTPQSLRILLSLAVGRSFTMTGASIPEWFDVISSGYSSVSLWFRNKFPTVILCFVVGIGGPVDFHVLINGDPHSFNLPWQESEQEPHICLFDLQDEDYLGDECTRMVIIGDAWNHVEVSYEFPGVCHHNIYRMGLHVPKQTTDADDVRFVDPNVPKQTTTNDVSWNTNHDEEFDLNCSSSKIGRVE
ncbi:hypothetical protein L6164_000980 [Bauhinia variegata]|uniref:Uncharacterized protein n=1 Tax=Bauhinia variegata TaxID=167791 RepID=A0ACB9QAC8_BAUVA|nr:hypothetical protein L6164_000980 [Bauhinia variegata]